MLTQADLDESKNAGKFKAQTWLDEFQQNWKQPDQDLMRTLLWSGLRPELRAAIRQAEPGLTKDLPE